MSKNQVTKHSVAKLASILDEVRKIGESKNRSTIHEFRSHIDELIALRNQMAGNIDLPSLFVIASIDDSITTAIASKLRQRLLSVPEAEQIIMRYRNRLFDLNAVAQELGMKVVGQDEQKPIGFYEIINYLDKQELHGGILNGTPIGSGSEWIFHNNNQLFFWLVVCGSLRNKDALEAYMVFVERGGDETRSPLGAEIRRVIPDILGRSSVPIGDPDGTLTAADVEVIARSGEEIPTS